MTTSQMHTEAFEDEDYDRYDDFMDSAEAYFSGRY